MRDELAQILENGAPAMADQARELLTKMETTTPDLRTWEAAAQLIESYLHDPHLTR